jgi:ribosome assembly protein YihI (activator of Der GTPase)
MSRSKKSRKPGVGSSGAVKESQKTVEAAPEKRIKKHKGKQAGNRQKEAVPQQEQQQVSATKDPRLGSKKLIDLGPVVTKAKTANKKIAKPKQSPIAAIRTIEPVEASENLLAQELEAIEQDEQILLILSKQEDDIELSEGEIDYFNEKMERHQELREKLGITDDDEENEEEFQPSQTKQSEDDLWDKFDNSDLSKFE